MPRLTLFHLPGSRHIYIFLKYVNQLILETQAKDLILELILISIMYQLESCLQRDVPHKLDTLKRTE
jgi:hypothetical protein